VMARELGVGAGSAPAGAVRASAEPGSSGPSGQPVDGEQDHLSARGKRTRASEPTDSRALPGPATGQIGVTARVVPALPIALRPTAQVGSRTESPAAARRVPDVVRISIGRVDVRVPAPSPRPPASPPPVPAAKAGPVSLHDYLRGQRSAR